MAQPFPGGLQWKPFPVFGKGRGLNGTFTEGALGACSTMCHANGDCTRAVLRMCPKLGISSPRIVQQTPEYSQDVLVNGVQPK